MPTNPVRLAFTMLLAALSMAPAHAANAALLATGRTEPQPTLATLEQRVSFDSGTLNGDGFRKVADIAEPRLQALGSRPAVPCRSTDETHPVVPGVKP